MRQTRALSCLWWLLGKWPFSSKPLFSLDLSFELAILAVQLLASFSCTYIYFFLLSSWEGKFFYQRRPWLMLPREAHLTQISAAVCRLLCLTDGLCCLELAVLCVRRVLSVAVVPPLCQPGSLSNSITYLAIQMPALLDCVSANSCNSFLVPGCTGTQRSATWSPSLGHTWRTNFDKCIQRWQVIE